MCKKKEKKVNRKYNNGTGRGVVPLAYLAYESVVVCSKNKDE